VRALVAGWFSFEGMGASAGDLLCRDVVAQWLRDAGVEVWLASAPPFTDGRRWEAVPREAVDAVVFVCGPIGNGWPIPEFLAHFAGKRLIGVNLTVLQPLSEWNPFDVLFERDSDRDSRPDLVFLTSPQRVPVAGLILVHPQREYGARGWHAQANEALRAVLRGREIAVVEIDTRLDSNAAGLHTAAQVESLIARMDAVFTTRLHGLALSLKNGVPALALDPIAGGAKLLRQARTIGWPYAFAADACAPADLEAAAEAVLSPAARELARETAERARVDLQFLKRSLPAAVRAPGGERG
jgi:hypothetical protein